MILFALQPKEPLTECIDLIREPALCILLRASRLFVRLTSFALRHRIGVALRQPRKVGNRLFCFRQSKSAIFLVFDLLDVRERLHARHFKHERESH